MPILLTVIILSGPQFATPVRIEAHGKPIDVTTGHAAPYVYDFDGDGTRDLLVGSLAAVHSKVRCTSKAARVMLGAMVDFASITITGQIPSPCSRTGPTCKAVAKPPACPSPVV